jgi:hypothetical protein
MRAMDFRSSAGTPKTIYLAVDWRHHESPLGGRSAVDCLHEECETPFAVNIRREFEKRNRDTKRVNRAWGLSGETENSGERVPPRAHGRIRNDSPRPEAENRIVRKYRQELGIACGRKEADGFNHRVVGVRMETIGLWRKDSNSEPFG